MIISDFVECEGCSAQIEHVGTEESLRTARQDEGYKMCEDCQESSMYDASDDDVVQCKSAQCFVGDCQNCTDVDGNWCDCNCHLPA